jgi:signal transduction histidine kinase
MQNSMLGRVLVADQEPALLNPLCAALAEQGYEARGFAAGQEALAALETQDFDLLLAELLLPGMDGAALLRAGLEIDPHLVGILMTGQGTIPGAVEAMKLGAFDYLLKPVEVRDLLPVLSRAMEARRLRQENVQLRETVAIYELSQAVAFNLDLTALLNKVVDAALQQCRADEASLLLPTAGGEEFYVAVARGAQREHILGQRIRTGQGIAGWVAHHGQPVVLHGQVEDPRFAPHWPRPEIQSALCAPLVAGGELVGVLNVNATRQRRPFTLGQVKALGLLLSTGAAALRSAQSHAQARQAEAQMHHAQKMKALGEMAGGIVHDFNNIVAIITGYCQVLMKGLEPGNRLRESAEEIRKAGARAEQLIRQLLAFSRREEPRPALVDLSQVAQEARGMLEPLLGRRFELAIGPGPGPEWVRAGIGQVEQVVVNLVINARDAMPQGGRIDLETAGVELAQPRPGRQGIIPPGRYALLRVRDQGIGMDEAVQGRLFEPFFTTKPQGTGLGLATVYGIVKQNGGFLEVESAPGQGSSFSVYLPRADGVLPGSSGDRRTLLVVDDETRVRQLVCRLLREAGYRVVEAEHPAGVLEMDRQGELSIDLLVADVVMPELSGVELAARLRERHPGLKVLYISGHEPGDLFPGGAPEPGAVFLHKPFRAEELLRQVQGLLEGSQA